MAGAAEVRWPFTTHRCRPRGPAPDRTPSESFRALMHRMQKDRNVDGGLVELAERQFNARLSAYRDAFTSKGQGSPAMRVAQNLLAEFLSSVV